MSQPKKFTEVLAEFLNVRDSVAHAYAYIGVPEIIKDQEAALVAAGVKLDDLMTPILALQELHQSSKAVPVKQYYYKSNGCKAKNSDDESCTCWHDEGTGLHKAERFSLHHPFLKWREKPAQAEDAIRVEEAAPNVEWTLLDTERLTNLVNSSLENRSSHGPKTHTVMLPRELPEMTQEEARDIGSVCIRDFGDETATCKVISMNDVRQIYAKIVEKFGG